LLLTHVNVGTAVPINVLSAFDKTSCSGRDPMEWERIRKQPQDYFSANLQDYEEYAKRFAWSQARALLDGLPNGGLNIAHEAIDRHVLAGRGKKLALRWIGRDDQIRDFSYSALGAAANRFANVLVQRGVANADRVFSLLGRVPELGEKSSRAWNMSS